MFVGHFGVAFAAKRFAPRVNLALLVAASDFIDVLWPILLLAGVEHVRIVPGLTPVTPLDFYDYPWTHSLLMVAVWAVAFGAVYFVATRYRAGAITTAALVVSHWFLDLLAHRPDLPVFPGGKVYGLGLWYSRPLTAVVELAIFFFGVGLYLRSTRARDRVGRYATASLVVFLTIMYVMNLQGSAPPSVQAVAWVGLAGSAILFGWCWWADKHRESPDAENAQRV